MWIAFKNYYLRDTTQQNRQRSLRTCCCELLSKIIIFVTRHNLRGFITKGFYSCELLSKIIIFVTRHNESISTFFLVTVVNCFQKLLSSWHDTTSIFEILTHFPLWIAFKNYYLRDTTQLPEPKGCRLFRCELLSKIIIFVTRHNVRWWYTLLDWVVNCFQKLLSSWHDTTHHLPTLLHQLLWIAFKNYYLRDTTQRRLCREHKDFCCELLSKIIIFVTRHNSLLRQYLLLLVVNCFQKLLSSWHDTTYSSAITFATSLWIAFKNYYLRDTTQQANTKASLVYSCELLSKIIIFVTRHNMGVK